MRVSISIGIFPKKIQYESDFSISLKKLRDTLSQKPRMMVICNPNNPTGTILDQDQLKSLLTDFSDTLFLVDEAYIEYSGKTLLPFSKNYSNLILLRTFSKIYGLAGLRIGYIIASSTFIEQIKKTR